MNMQDIIKKANKLKDNDYYSPVEIAEMGLIVDTNLQPSYDTVVKRIKQGLLPYINVGTEKMPKYKILGKDIKEFVNKFYKIQQN